MGRSTTMGTPLVVSTLAEKSQAGESAEPRASLALTVAREWAGTVRPLARVEPSPLM